MAVARDIGLRRGTVEVVPYRSVWPALFMQERRALLSVLNRPIEHVGSTAVPGLAAKPIIDMILGLDDLTEHVALIEPLVRLGYEYMPERVFEDRVFLPKGPRDCRTHHLSVVRLDGEGWLSPLRFRDRLIQDPVARTRYQALKLQLATRYPDDRAAYTRAKDAMISELLAG